MKKQETPEVSPKNTKEQILPAYQDVLRKLKEWGQKADQATDNVQLIACRALDTSSQRYIQDQLTQQKIKGQASQK